MGIQVDAFAVEEMIIEHLKPSRTVAQSDLQTLSGQILPDGGIDSAVSSELIDDIIRVHGVPTTRQYVNDETILQALIENSISADLPLILTGNNKQIVVDGYRDANGFEVHILDPEVNGSAWSSLNGLFLSVPSITIREVIAIPASISIDTNSHGILIYDVASDSLAGTPPPDTLSKEAIKSTAPYVSSSDTVYLLDFGNDCGDLGLYTSILSPAQYGGLALVEEVLRSWETKSFDSLANFPLLPIDNNGYLDISQVEHDIQELSLLYRSWPHITNLSSRSMITPKEAMGIETEYAHFLVIS